MGIFLGRREALRDLDTSNEGFWRSFQVILLVAPLYAVTSLADWNALPMRDPAADAVSGGAFAASTLVTLVLDWITFPVLLAALGGLLGIKPVYATFIVARNWSVPIMLAPAAGVSVLGLLGFFPGDIIVIPSLIALGFALRFSYMVARIALDVEVPVAIGYVLLDFLVSLAIVRLVGRLFGVDVW